ncbi:MAG TPA: hypothetical protein VIT62_00610 [Lysobacter sp.]
MKRTGIRITVLALALAPVLAQAQGASVEERLRALEQRQTQLEQALRERDARIQQLEAERGTAVAPAMVATPAPSQPAPVSAAQPPVNATASATAAPSQPAFGQPAQEPAQWGAYEGGKGMVLARTDMGELDWSVFSYARYLNQGGLDDTYTDAFGRTRPLDLRNDMQLQKITMNFKGWLFDPKFRYLFYAWTSNTSQGLGAQVVLGGYLSYLFDDSFNLAAGIGSLPSTRSTNWTFPNWLKVDNRTMADEYFRGSYTSGLWAWGNITDDLKYRVMVGNNLSQLGVDAAQLDNQFNTFSGALWWMPTTGEYGPGEGFGDYEWHDDAATMFGANFTHSREDAQGQPDTDSFENSQIRLSDGTLLFSLDPFNTGGSVRKATYEMAAVNAGVKYHGLSLEGEYYWRRVDDFRTVGIVPVDELTDHGFQLQASAMLKPDTLQAYLSGSKINGEYGNPWDAAIGVNWYPFKRKEFRLNTQALYMERSAVGYAAVPYLVGGNGWVFSTDFVLAF